MEQHKPEKCIGSLSSGPYIARCLKVVWPKPCDGKHTAASLGACSPRKTSRLDTRPFLGVRLISQNFNGKQSSD